MNAYEFTLSLINSETILSYEDFTEKTLNAVLTDDLTQKKFRDVISEFRSFEGHNHKFCVNFTGAWLKYALNGEYNKSQMNSTRILRDILGIDFSEKSKGCGVPPHEISVELYNKTNWIDDLDNVLEDRDTKKMYTLKTVKKFRPHNNSYHDTEIIMLRPRDFLDVLTSSKCVSEYRKYFIMIAEVRRSYQETYLPWIVANKEKQIVDLHKKMDKVIEQNNQLLEDSKITKDQNKHLIMVAEDSKLEIMRLNSKIDALFEFMLSFARMTIPTWIGSSVIKQQFDTLATNKSTAFALKHLKVMFIVGFYIQKKTTETRSIDGEDISIKYCGKMKVYACCTNFADIGARIRLLYNKHTDNEDNIMFMFKPKVISLISCEINTERIILENSNIFPPETSVKWDSSHKCFDILVQTRYYSNAHKIFSQICTNAANERFQGYQMRLDEYNKGTNVKVDSKILDYIDKIDYEFFSATKPFCQTFVNTYVSQSLDSNDKVVEWEYSIPNRKSEQRPDLNNVKLSAAGYSLRKIERLIEQHTATDHIEHMVCNKIISKDDIPALKALAEFENIDLSDIEIPEDLDY